MLQKSLGKESIENLDLEVKEMKVLWVDSRTERQLKRETKQLQNAVPQITEITYESSILNALKYLNANEMSVYLVVCSGTLSCKLLEQVERRARANKLIIYFQFAIYCYNEDLFEMNTSGYNIIRLITPNLKDIIRLGKIIAKNIFEDNRGVIMPNNIPNKSVELVNNKVSEEYLIWDKERMVSELIEAREKGELKMKCINSEIEEEIMFNLDEEQFKLDTGESLLYDDMNDRLREHLSAIPNTIYIVEKNIINLSCPNPHFQYIVPILPIVAKLYKQIATFNNVNIFHMDYRITSGELWHGIYLSLSQISLIHHCLGDYIALSQFTNVELKRRLPHTYIHNCIFKIHFPPQVIPHSIYPILNSCFRNIRCQYKGDKPPNTHLDVCLFPAASLFKILDIYNSDGRIWIDLQFMPNVYTQSKELCMYKGISLENISIPKNILSSVTMALSLSHSLTYLNLKNCNLDSEMTIYLCEGLTANNTLLEIDLDQNLIGNDGALAVARWMLNSKSLLLIHISQNPIHEKGAKALGEAIEQNKSLKKYKLIYGDSRDSFIVDGLKNNTSITKFFNYKRLLNEDSAKSLGYLLCLNSTLMVLNLNHSRIGNKAVSEISKGLKVNKSLKDVDLNFNHIGDKGALAISNALYYNDSIQQFNMISNRRYAIEGVEAICKALQVNKTLIALQLDGNEFNAEHAITIINALQNNSTLTFLSLRRNNFDEETKKLFRNINPFLELFEEMDLDNSY